MQRLSILSPLALALSLHAGDANALGFGKVAGTPALGHPLSFSVGLRLDAADVLEPGCVSAEVMAGDRVLPADTVSARLVRVGATGERRVRVTTTTPIDEPSLSITVHAGCPRQLSRTFVAFADPPHLVSRIGDPETEAADGGGAPGSTSPLAAAASPGATAAPDVRRGAASRAPPPPRREGAAAPADRAVPAAAAAAATGAGRPATRRPSATPAAAADRPVLQLDPIESEEMAQPSLRMTMQLGSLPTAGGTTSPPPADPETAQRLVDQERLKTLEAAVRRLSDEARAKDDAVRALQARVRDADQNPIENPIVLGLAALCLGLAAALAAVLWMRRRDRAQAAWWAAASAEAAEELQAPVAEPAAAAAEPDDTRPQPVSAIAVPPARPPAVPVARSAPVAPSLFTASTVDEVTLPRAAPRLPAGSSRDVTPAEEPRRPMSAEELIDLEQQVEFFVVLGQDDAAIDLLMGHVRSTSGVSPLPYLKLLEIYRRREEREPYERIRERFNRRFNAYAPEWGVDPEQGTDLEGYADVLTQVQGLWSTPSAAMELLERLLFQRDAGPTFDVPAYRELLFLYSIARDRAERETSTTGVDLLLPFGDESRVADAASAASTDVQVVERLTLDLDVSTQQPSHLVVESPPASDLDRPLEFHLDIDDEPGSPAERSGR